MNKLLSILTLAVFLSTVASALTINDVTTSDLSPGGEGTIRVELENNLDDDVENVALRLTFTELPFIPVGSSERAVTDIESDDEEDFTFRIKAASDIIPGDYEIPYTLEYTVQGSDAPIIRTGSFGVKVIANPELSYTLSTSTPVLERQGTITLRIVNTGFYDARFVTVKVLPSGFTLLSEDEVYIGNVDSDDFETATFDARFTSKNSYLDAIVEYRDFNNELQQETISLPIKVYDEQEAIQLGIIQQNFTLYYIIVAVVIILLIILWRTIRKRRRMKRSLAARKVE